MAQILCPPSVVPSNQTKNFELVTDRDSSLGGSGAVRFTVSGQAPNNQNPNRPRLAFSSFSQQQADAGLYVAAAAREKGFENATGVNATLQGQSRYQALNVYRVRTQCDRDPANGRFDVLWSIMAQDNVADFSNSRVDIRNDDTPGNRLDYGRAHTGGPAEQNIGDSEGPVVQVTSPSPYVPPLPVLPVPPPPSTADNSPPIPTTPPPSPPPPPPRSH